MWFFVTIFIIALGCGGGGGGTTSGGTTSGGTGANPVPGQYIEFVDDSGAWMDPFNLQIGDTGMAYIVNYDGQGTRTELVVTGWLTTAPGNVGIAANGRFTVSSSPGAGFIFQGTTSIFTVPTNFTQAAAVPSAPATVNGRVVEIGLFTGLPSNTGIPHLRVNFFNASGNLVGSARTMKDGTFSAIVPTTITELMVDGETILTPTYHRSIYYAAKIYSPLDTVCRIQIGPISPGISNMSASIGVHKDGGSPPPPPNACS